MYKFIAIDMDGTLLKEDKSISKETYRAIQRAKSKDVKVVLTTGRPIHGVIPYLKQLNLISKDDYAIAYNGALIQNTETKDIIAQTLMSFEDAHYLYRLSQKLNVNIHALTDKNCITPKWSKYSQLESDLNAIPMEYVDFNNLDKNTTIVKIMFIDEPEILQKAVDNLPKEIYEKYTVLRSAPYFLEFLDKNVNKGQGVKTLAKKLGIKKEEVICVGDAGNDLHMIQFAGLGVAMGNAFPEVKKAADYVTLSNEEDGVAHVIDKFILNDEKAS